MLVSTFTPPPIPLPPPTRSLVGLFGQVQPNKPKGHFKRGVGGLKQNCPKKPWGGQRPNLFMLHKKGDQGKSNEPRGHFSGGEIQADRRGAHGTRRDQPTWGKSVTQLPPPRLLGMGRGEMG